MNISKQLGLGVIIGLLIGASFLYAFTQSQIIAKDSQISGFQTQVSDLQTRVTTLENYILATSQKPAGNVGVALAGPPRALIQNVSVIQGGLLVMAKATVGQDVTVTTSWIHTAAGAFVSMNTRLYSTVLPMDGTLTSVTVFVPNGILISGSNYVMTLVSAQGESFYSPIFVVP